MATMLIDGSKENACRQAEANAIRAKTGGSAQINYDFQNGKGFSDAIAAIPTGGGGGGTPEHGVFFLDYDGNIVETWPAGDVTAKTALPSNPSHSGLVAQGWNWTLANIKSYISKYEGSKVFVGQMYKTASGLTEFDITVTKVTGLTVTCNMVGNKTWGDGTSDALTTHTYVDYGNYTITCDGNAIPSGSYTSGGVFGSTSSNLNRYWCTAVRIGENVTSIGSYAFYHCYSLTSIAIPDSVTSIVGDVFYYCESLTSITIPNSVKSIGKSMFYYCYSFTSIAIPDSVTSIGNSAFYNCHSLTSIIIPDSVKSIGNNAFFGCESLTSITIPNGVTSIGSSAFYNCHSLTSIIIPGRITSISDMTFFYCYSLVSVTIPGSIRSIGNSAFTSCFSLFKYDFTSATAVPTLSTNAFQDINGICKIVVPDALYDSWKAATNWSTYADYIYKASEVTD